MAALIPCPDCGAAISRRATVCPRCGMDNSPSILAGLFRELDYFLKVVVGLALFLALGMWIFSLFD